MIDNTMEQTKLAPGFANYVAASQQVFRLALDAMSRPARALPFPENPDDLALDMAPLPNVPAALALSLLDALTPVWISPSWRRAENWLRFHCGCPVAASPAEASIVLAASLDELPPLDTLNQGSPRYPDSSATVVLFSGLKPTGSDRLTATGPGIKNSAVFEGHGLSEKFLKQWQDNNGSYPLGVDVFLAGDSHLAGLPRSLKLEGGSVCM